MRSSSSESRLGRYLMGSLRVGALLLVALVVLLYVDYRAARASVFERLLGFGESMAPYLDDPRTTERAREVRVNGASFLVAAGKSDHPPQMVRKFYRDRYLGRDGGLSAFAAELEKKHALPPGMPDGRGFEFGDTEKGGVAALDFGMGSGKSDIRSFVARMKKVVIAGDLGDASLRYCYTERNEKGGTRFLNVWTDQRFNLNQLLPPGGVGDAPGFELDRVPRLPGTVRILSTEEVGMPQRMVVYEGVGSPLGAMLFYRSQLRSLGWTEEPTFAQIAENQGKTGLHFTRGPHELFLSLTDRVAGQGVNIVAMQTR